MVPRTSGEGSPPMVTPWKESPERIMCYTNDSGQNGNNFAWRLFIQTVENYDNISREIMGVLEQLLFVRRSGSLPGSRSLRPRGSPP